MTREEFVQNINSVLEVFNHFYGEERVSCTIPSEVGTVTILVHFPEVTITNEFNNTHLIRDLYVKVLITPAGKLASNFSIARSTYTVKEISSGYKHSHTYKISESNCNAFSECCLGRGPIRSTIASLYLSNDPLVWQLFCLELKKYVETESIEGGPYIKMSSIGYKSQVAEYVRDFPVETSNLNTKYIPIIKDFIKYILKNKILTFSYKTDRYSLNCSYIEYILIISQAFINYINSINNGKYTLDWLIKSNYIVPRYIDEYKGVLFKPFSNHTVSRKRVCTFKGVDVYTNIIDEEDNDNNVYYLLNSEIYNFIVIEILNTVNLVKLW